MEGRVESFEFDAGIGGGKTPVDGGGSAIATLLLGVDLAFEFLPCPDATREALTRQSGELDLGHVEPTAMQRRVVDLQFLGDATRLSRSEGVIERCGRMGTQVIHHQHDFLGLGVVELASYLLLKRGCRF